MITDQIRSTVYLIDPKNTAVHCWSRGLGGRDWELFLRRWRLGSMAFCRRWTGSLSSRPLMLG